MFITMSFGEPKEKIEELCALVKDAGFEDFCFIRDVEHYQKMFNDPQELMSRAREEIAKSDMLLLDATTSPTGRAIEAGVAFALGKKVIIIMKKGTKVKETVEGIAEGVIDYDDIKDIVPDLKKFA